MTVPTAMPQQRPNQHDLIRAALDRFLDENHHVDVSVHFATLDEYDAWVGEEKRVEKVKGERQTTWKETTTGKHIYEKGAVRVVVFKPSETA